LKKEQVPE